MKPSKKGIEIRRELKALIYEKRAKCITEKDKNRALNEARAEINKKYGKDWRQPTMREARTQEPSIYDGHENGEHWMD